MRIDVATIFPAMFAGPLGTSIVARAQERRLIELRVHDLREYATDRHRTVDDYPYGGGAGMVMRAEPFFRLVEAIGDDPAGDWGDGPDKAPDPTIVLLCPAGRRLDQRLAQAFAALPWLVLLCGHYEGVDERVAEGLRAQPVSIGDFVLTGGELPAMALVDAVVRLLPGVLGGEGSLAEESFAAGLLEYPQYTRPAEYRGMRVPEVLLSGDHAAIAAWRRREALRRTALHRPELLAEAELTPAERAAVTDLKRPQ